jgi:uncharacterized membrane protein
MGGDHTHGTAAPPGPVPPRVRRLLLGAVAPFLAATVVGLVALWPRGPNPARPAGIGLQAKLVNATVVSVRRLPCGGGPVTASQCQSAQIRVTSGPDKRLVTALELSVGPGNPTLRKGDAIVVGRSLDATLGTFYSFADYQRRTPLLLLALIFTAVVVAVGRWRGVAALGGLVITFAVLVKFVLPAVLHGENPMLVAIVGSAAVMFVIMYLAHGLNAQTTTALLGTLASLAIIALLAGLFVALGRIVNLGSEEATFLQVSASQVNLRGLLLGGIIIGSLGVLNDVTVTQASAVWQLRAARAGAGVAELYRSAMRIGRDHIASTVDTLVLAYAGASLPLLLLFTLASRPVGDVLTGELVAEEIVRTLVGSIGLVASVPITTYLAALVASQVGSRKPARAARRAALPSQG